MEKAGQGKRDCMYWGSTVLIGVVGESLIEKVAFV